MLVSVKTIQEQTVLLARLSDLSQSRMSASFKPVASSSSLQCSCLTQSRTCWSITTAISGKVTGMANIVSTGMVWCRQVSGAINCMMQNVSLSFGDFISTDYSYEDFVKRKLIRNTPEKWWFNLKNIYMFKNCLFEMKSWCKLKTLKRCIVLICKANLRVGSAIASKLQKSFAWGVCMEYLAFHTKPRFGLLVT